MNCKAIYKLTARTGLYLKRHSSTILTCIGAIGVIATTVTAVKATPKALEVLKQAEEDKGAELTKLEVVVTAGPAYIPSAAIGVSTIACIFGANVLNKKQQAAVASAYALADNAYKEYRGKVKELYGVETDNKIRDAIAKDKRNEDIHAYAPGCASLPSSGEKQLFYEEYRGKYFEATMDDVINAEYHLNRNFALRGCASLNEFYEFLGLEKTEFGDVLGWNSMEMVEGGLMPWIDFSHRKTTVTDDGLSCYIIEMEWEPIADYDLY